jgi:hypothetical protein
VSADPLAGPAIVCPAVKLLFTSTYAVLIGTIPVAPVAPVAPTGISVIASQANPFHFHVFPDAVNSSFSVGSLGKLIGIYYLFLILFNSCLTIICITLFC